MFVSDSNIFTSSGMRIRIISMDGTDYITEVNPDLKVDKLKIRSLGFFFNPSVSMKTSLYYKILVARTGKVLNEEKTLSEEGVQDNDELLLLKKRLTPQRFDSAGEITKDESKKVPTAETIKKITSSLPKATQAASSEQGPTADFQSEHRKILVSLIEASQKLLCMNPEASKIFKQAEDLLNEKSETKIDESSLKQLTDMGFSETRAKKALILNKMSVMMAMDWLIQHESDPDIDTSLPGLNEEFETSDTQSDEMSASGGHEGIKGDNSPDSSPSHPVSTNILRSLRAFRRREFKPNQRALQHLIEMGFPEKDVIEALRYARNDQDAACDWLLGERKTRPEESDDGLDTNSHIYKAIMANPTVQLGLNNPRCLIAFLQMLDSPWPFNVAQQWLNDPDTGPLLLQISRIYHAEKHADRSEPEPVKSDNEQTASSPVSSDQSDDQTQTLTQDSDSSTVTDSSRSQEGERRRHDWTSPLIRSSRTRPPVNSNSKQTTL